MQPTAQTSNRPSPWKRYGPFIAIVVVIAVAIGAFAILGGGDDDSDDVKTSDTTSAQAAGGPVVLNDANRDSIDWGPNCDPEVGRVKIPYTYAAPCVEPFTGDNGGATASGVTADSIKVVVYQGDPKLNPLQAALVRSSGADVDLATGKETYQGYLDLFSKYYELYGRKLDVSFFRGTGGPQDETAARADAIAIAEMKPFAVIDGPGQTPVFADELATRGVVCLGFCALAIPEDVVSKAAPYVWGVGPTPNQAGILTAEMIDNLLAGKKAEFAGSDEIKAKTRKFGGVHYDTVDGQQEKSWADFEGQLSKRGIKLASDIPFLLDVARGQENARTMISKLKSAGVTSVIFYGDPLTPSYLTKEATAQDYYPEWIIGPNVYVDTAVFGRTFDQKQWANAFGLSLTAARGEQKAQESYNLYIWQYGKPAPNNLYAVILGNLLPFFQGVQLAGPDLTPESFQAGLFRNPVTGGTPLSPTVSRGEHDIWPGIDYGGSDDATLIWWNPDSNGVDEIGNSGKGMYEYTNRGERYTVGEWPKEDPGLFDAKTSVQIYTTIPPEYRPPSYPSPAK